MYNTVLISYFCIPIIFINNFYPLGYCIKNFKWNGGGTINGEKWNEAMKLPTDSELLFYIFSSYMKYPHWVF